MHDLKAAAKRLRESVAMLASEIEFWGIADIASQKSTERLAQASSDNLLAAKALEAWAWMAENGWRLENDGKDCWVCTSDVFLQNAADTPLGAVLAAREGERDA